MIDLRRASARGRPSIMGILNVTPDSFSDGGKWDSPRLAVEHAFEMADSGADIIDIGAESTRPSASPVSAEEEIARLEPVLRELVPSLSVPVSVDTMKAAVARRAVELGAEMVNDVYGLRGDGMAEFCAESGVAVVIMHMERVPGTTHSSVMGDDYMDSIRDFLRERTESALEAGIRRDRIVLDPGIGFGKTPAQNTVIMRSATFFSEGYPVLIAPSRKRFLAEAFPGMDRDQATYEAVKEAVAWGADMVRVHDVAGTVNALRLSHRSFWHRSRSICCREGSSRSSSRRTGRRLSISRRAGSDTPRSTPR
ncbi:MAG: dihydropteroate synthase [Candidatus Methanomethylophilaceae archaeon]|nr:dihydropteroate synthase [Candidatus Methanomethylophilaceae archaeon]